jgi:AcrR family transcriptional regulator
VFEEDTRHSGEKREAILEAALALVAEHGLQHTPMSLISKRARVSAGGIYHHFASKEDLLQTLHWRIMQEMIRAIFDRGPARPGVDQGSAPGDHQRIDVWCGAQTGEASPCRAGASG